jgi:putative radical SAM enzyme (TIGR03279 family)
MSPRQRQIAGQQADETGRLSKQAQAPGLRIHSVAARSALARCGLRAGDTLVAIDGLRPRDVIDLQVELPDARALHIVRADGEPLTLTPAPPLDPGALQLVDPVPDGIRECNNHCEFCFIRGLPGGLRPTLYVFDDDYRYSFLWGNFLTLTNLHESDWARIGYQRLSPLNVSVHATDDAVRRKLLVNRHAPSILPQLRRLAEMGIDVHTQIVLCAGLNDGAVLDRSIADLAALHPSVLSVSVVPVGLTRYSRVKNIVRPNAWQAEQAVEQCERWQARLRGQVGVGFVYASDELYLLAGRTELPPSEAYDGFPVASNGVGLLRSMLNDWTSALAEASLPELARRPRKVTWMTGRLAAPALERMADELAARAGWRPSVRVVDNQFFGGGVTVSGLLTGIDLIAALRELPADVEDVVLPRGVFGFDGRRTLDGVSAREVGAAHPGRVHLATTAAELLDILSPAPVGPEPPAMRA